MRLLLIGCTGFIGGELLPRLLNAGHHLTIISRKPSSKFKKSLKSKTLCFLQADPSKQSTWQETKIIDKLNDIDGVINLAGEPIAEKRWTKAQCKIIEESRLLTTQGLIEAIRTLKKPPKVLINASAIGFYGTSQNNYFNEENKAGKDFLSKLCNQWETIASQKPRKTKLVIIRIGIVLGGNGGALGKMLPVFRAGFGGPIGNGKQWMSWIHRTDLCEIIEKSLLNNNWSGVINAVSPNPCSMAEFSSALGKTLGRPNLLPVPGPFLKLLLGDGAEVVLKGQHVSSIRLKKLGYNFLFPNLEKALKAATERN
tara:strand:+ start:5353 stop:6288 length:936 start_codon:yes stop_codon:yes gene_type:complete